MASTYPANLDTFVTTRADGTPLTTTHASDHDLVNDAINKIEAELGVNPRGVYSSLAARLSYVMQNTPTVDYTLVLADASKIIEINKATAAIVTVPPNGSVAFPVGTVIEFVQLGAGQVSFAPGAGVTIRSPNGNVKITGLYSSASLRKRATDEWVLCGDLISSIFYGAIIAPFTFGKAVSGSASTPPSGAKSTTVAEISLASHGTPSVRTNHVINIRARTTTGATGVIRAALYEGATNRSGTLETSILSNGLANYTLAISDANAALISSYANLSIRVWGFDYVGNPLVFEIADLSLTVPTASAPPTFGSSLPARIAQSTGSVTNVATTAELTSALSSVANGGIINITANLNGGGAILTITRAGSAAAPVTITSDPGVLITNFYQWNIRGSYLRFKGLNIGSATLDGIKIDTGANHIEIEKCKVHNSSRQGIIIGGAGDQIADVQIWDSEIYINGTTGAGFNNLDHGVYATNTLRLTIANTLFYGNPNGFAMQIYPECVDTIITCCVSDEQLNTLGGGGGPLVIGSETGQAVTNLTAVGLLLTNGQLAACHIWAPSGSTRTNINVYDSIAYLTGSPQFETASGVTYTNCANASVDPLYVNRTARDYTLQAGSPAISKIQSARYGYVPALDKNGVARVTPDAGCYKA